jgi:hypothetical protein
LAYGNNLTVVPGNSYTVVVGAGAPGTPCQSAGTGGGGAVRVIWPGCSRSFPSTCTAS